MPRKIVVRERGSIHLFYIQPRDAAEPIVAMPEGRAMGWTNDSAVHSAPLRFDDGDRLVIYTDGITE